MGTFSYAIRYAGGLVDQGAIKADNVDQAKELLKLRGGQIVKLEASSGLAEIRILDRPPSAVDKALFCSQFAMMSRANMPQPETLSALIRTTANYKFKEALVDVKAQTERGVELSKAFSAHPAIFDRSFVALMRAALRTNTVAQTLDRLSQMYERNDRIAGLVKGALIPPMITVVIGIVVMFVVSIYAIPSFKDMLEDLEADLPLATRILIDVTTFLRQPLSLTVMAGVLLALIVGLRQYASTPGGRERLDRLILRVPKVGHLVLLGSLARVNRTLSTLLDNQVAKVESLDIAAQAASNKVIESVLLEGRDNVDRGNHLYQVLERYPKLFPATITGMVYIGEDRGDLAPMLDRVSDFYERTVETEATNLTKYLEPFMLVIMGVMVGSLLFAIMMPIMQATQKLSGT